MKKILICCLFLVGCSRGTGTFSGRAIDISWEGWIFKTCEIDAQYGDQSSKHVRFSSPDKSACDSISSGDLVRITYDQTFLKCITCASDDLILKIEKTNSEVLNER